MPDERWVNDVEERLDKIEDRLQKAEDRITKSEKDHIKMSVYVEQIFDKLKSIETTINNGITKNDLLGLFDTMNNQNNVSSDKWQKWTLAIIAATLGIALTYIFKK